MLHDFCNTFNQNAYCIKKFNDKTCNYKYSKSFCKYMIIKQNEYSVYHQLNDDIKVKKHEFLFNNHHVILYNFYFSQKYDYYINVKIVIIITSVKYLYKYIYKDHNRAYIFF